VCAVQLDIDPEELKNMLPRLRSDTFENLLKFNANLGGLCLWWVVAGVEEESQIIYKKMRPFHSKLEPLHTTMHRLHFEEEARHAPYAFLMLDLARTSRSLTQRILNKTDLISTDIMKSMWLVTELKNSFSKRSYRSHHPFFKTLSQLSDKAMQAPLMTLVSQLWSHAPYISDFLNPHDQVEYKKSCQLDGSWALPYPKQRASVLSVA
jgi:hypothetical protein